MSREEYANRILDENAPDVYQTHKHRDIEELER